MARPRTRTDALAEQIRDAAIALLRSDSLAGLTTRRIAAHAGTNIAALNELFGSRDGLVNAVALHGFNLLASQMRDCSNLGDRRERLLGYAGVFRAFARTEPALVEVMFSRPLIRPVAHDHGAAECRRLLVAEFEGLQFTDHLRATAETAAIGLTALMEGLALKERNGLLGSTVRQRDLVWRLSVAAYLDGLQPHGFRG